MIYKTIYIAFALLCSACASSGQSLWAGSNNFGVVVNSRLMQGFSIKNGVEGKSDAGRRLFGFAELNERGGQTSGYGGIGLPKWVDVSWREPIIKRIYFPITGKSEDTLNFGKKIGDYRVEVASRIPQEPLQYASAKKGRAIKLMFRILDDDVVLGWCVEEIGVSNDWFEPNYQGDFMPAKWFNGKLITIGWYLDKKTGQRVETTTGR